MGLFDKLKKNGLGAENAVASEGDASVQTPAMPTSKIEKEDFSGLSDLQVLEKIDQYVNEFKRTPNTMVFNKLSAVVDEFDLRFSSIPLSKRGAIAQDWSFLKIQRDNMRGFIDSPGGFAIKFADQIVSYVAKIYTELCK